MGTRLNVREILISSTMFPELSVLLYIAAACHISGKTKASIHNSINILDAIVAFHNHEMQSCLSLN
jgi:hypothetical protein